MICDLRPALLPLYWIKIEASSSGSCVVSLSAIMMFFDLGIMTYSNGVVEFDHVFVTAAAYYRRFLQVNVEFQRIPDRVTQLRLAVSNRKRSQRGKAQNE
ncbi:hypothetical protein Tco_0060022 [Tanacetum coccineum]